MPVILSKSSRAGETSLTKEEALEWCEKWAKDKKYVMVGQNCWTMVHEFLTTHEGCELTEEIQCAITHFVLLAVPHAASTTTFPPGHGLSIGRRQQLTHSFHYLDLHCLSKT